MLPAVRLLLHLFLSAAGCAGLSSSRAGSMHGGRIAHQRPLFSTMDAASNNPCSF